MHATDATRRMPSLRHQPASTWVPTFTSNFVRRGRLVLSCCVPIYSALPNDFSTFTLQQSRCLGALLAARARHQIPFLPDPNAQYDIEISTGCKRYDESELFPRYECKASRVMSLTMRYCAFREQQMRHGGFRRGVGQLWTKREKAALLRGYGEVDYHS